MTKTKTKQKTKKKEVISIEAENDSILENIGPIIKLIRLSSHMTLQDLSDKASLSKPLLSQIENGLVSPPLKTLIKISNALGKHLSFWFLQNDIVMGKKRKKEALEAITIMQEALSKLNVLIT